MNLKELDSFKLSDAVTFHDHLNPALWAGHKLKPAIKEQLLIIAKDFLEELGVDDLDVVDITISGSNAAYSYTKHSDLDLHILVDTSKLNNDEIYKELFNAKKTLYNDSHHITINNVPVELYVQDASEPVVSLGEYSILHDDWLRLPTKRRANFDQTATKEKYAKLQKLIEVALLSKDIHKVQAVLKTIKRYRQAGLDRGGEFGPENLAFKALRSQGYITKLYQLRDKLHSEILTIENMYQNPVKVQEDNLAEQFAREFNQQEVDEARTNPDQNVKLESGMKELEAVAKTISDPENWAVSMTSEPKLGINPQVGISEDTPKGIYFYPLNYVLGKIHSRKPLPWGNDYPYIQLFQYDRSGEMTRETKVDPAQLKQALNQYCSDEVIQQAIDDPEYDGTPYWTIYDCLSRLGKGDETNIIRWNKVLRDLGFTSVYDPGHGWIAHNEPTQGVVLDPRIIKQHKTITNRKQASVVTPAKIEQTIFETMDMELARNRAWQAYDPDGVKLRAAAKEYAKKPDFKPWFGKPGTEEIYDKAASWGRWGARQLSDEAWAWYKAQQAEQPVNEAFDQPYKLKWEKGDYGDVDAYAKLDDGNYLSIMFNKGYNQDKEEAWSVEFFRNNSQEVTGEGDAQRVFATVLGAIQTFIKKYKPNKVIFSASKDNWAKQQQNSESRASLYDRLVQRYSKAWGFRAFRADAGDKVIYELSRIKPLVAKEDTMQYAAEKTSATNPYGGQRDIQYRGSISEAPVIGNYADLYHTAWTDNGALDNILQSGKLVPGTNKWLSLTRDSRLDYAKMMGQFAEFVIDQNKLRQRVKLDQYDDFKGKGDDEAEERVNVPIPLKGFVKSIHLPASWKHDEKARQYYEPKIKQYGIPFYYDTMGSQEDRNADVPRLEESSGYIPSEKEKNDPRFKTALTVDVKPDSIKKNAKAFAWLTDRAGIPPTANPNGKF